MQRTTYARHFWPGAKTHYVPESGKEKEQTMTQPETIEWKVGDKVRVKPSEQHRDIFQRADTGNIGWRPYRSAPDFNCAGHSGVVMSRYATPAGDVVVVRFKARTANIWAWNLESDTDEPDKEQAMSDVCAMCGQVGCPACTTEIGTAHQSIIDECEGKPRIDLISPYAQEREGAWLALHAHDDARKWERGGEGYSIAQCLASLERHVQAYKRGDLSEDHMAAIRTRAGFIIHFEEMIKRRLLPETLADLPWYEQHG
ncbi:MAG: hypothetical protein IMZ62_06405 [Chloroflexi bacterium]|nr:hypothetical protein [Chloroflexota bacterium]